jgi:hypothetical protein
MRDKRIVIASSAHMTDAEVESALKSISVRSLEALIQVLDGYRHQHASVSANHAEANNPLGMSKEAGWYEALSAMIVEFEGYKENRD